MEKPLVSIIVPTYNGAKYIRKAIESIWKQTYQKIEIIIIDDGSKDETPRIISELSKKDPRIVILTNKTNLGFVKSLNKGARKVQGMILGLIQRNWKNKLNFLRSSQTMF